MALQIDSRGAKERKRKHNHIYEHTNILTDKEGTKVTTEWMLNTFY